jgi:hypothetical protein
MEYANVLLHVKYILTTVMLHYRIRLAYSNGHLPICGAYKVLLTRHFCTQWAVELTGGGGKYKIRLLFFKWFSCFCF